MALEEMPGGFVRVNGVSKTNEMELLEEVNGKLDRILSYMEAAESAIKGVKLPPMVANMMGIPPQLLEGSSHEEAS